MKVPPYVKGKKSYQVSLGYTKEITQWFYNFQNAAMNIFSFEPHQVQIQLGIPLYKIKNMNIQKFAGLPIVPYLIKVKFTSQIC